MKITVNLNEGEALVLKDHLEYEADYMEELAEDEKDNDDKKEYCVDEETYRRCVSAYNKVVNAINKKLTPQIITH